MSCIHAFLILFLGLSYNISLRPCRVFGEWHLPLQPKLSHSAVKKIVDHYLDIATFLLLIQFKKYISLNNSSSFLGKQSRKYYMNQVYRSMRIDLLPETL